MILDLANADTSQDPQALIDACLRLGIESHPLRAGNFAAQVCQVCGVVNCSNSAEPDLLIHRPSREEYVCNTCREFAGHRTPSERCETLGRLSRRFCEICARGFPRRQLEQHGHRYLCKSCRTSHYIDIDTGNLVPFLDQFVRARYIGRTCHTDSGRRAFYEYLLALHYSYNNAVRITCVNRKLKRHWWF